MEDITLAALQKSLDLLSVRQQFLAQNIANAGSEKYRSVQVSFEQELSAAMAKGVEEIEAIDAKITTRISDSLDPEIRLDLELAQSSQTAMRYNALVEVLSRQMGLSRAVIQSGQR